METGQPVWSILTHSNQVQYMADGSRILTNDTEGGVIVLNGRTGEQVTSIQWIQVADGTCESTISSDGRRVAILAGNERLRFWNWW